MLKIYKNLLYLRLQLEEMESANEIASVPPEEMVAEKQTLLSKLHSFEKKEERSLSKQTTPEAEKTTPVIEPPKPAPKKIEVQSKAKICIFEPWYYIPHTCV